MDGGKDRTGPALYMLVSLELSRPGPFARLGPEERGSGPVGDETGLTGETDGVMVLSLLKA